MAAERLMCGSARWRKFKWTGFNQERLRSMKVPARPANDIGHLQDGRSSIVVSSEKTG